jgi:chemotaxis protein MotD
MSLSVKENTVPSVPAVQPIEPRPQPAAAAPSRGAQPFSELLDGAADARRERDDAPSKAGKRPEPSAPASRAKSRAESLARGDTPEKAEANDVRREGAIAPVPEEQTVSDEAGSFAPETGRVEATAAEVGTAVSSATGETAVGADAATLPVMEGDVDAPVAGQEVADNSGGEMQQVNAAPEQTIASAADTAPQAPAEHAVVPVAVESKAAIAPDTAPGAAAPISTDAKAPTAPQAPVTNTGPVAPAKIPAEAETASLAPPAAGNSRATDAKPAQASATPPASAPAQALAAIQGDAGSTGDQDSQLPQQSGMPQAEQPKPQQANASRPAEPPSLPAPAADIATQRVQINTGAPPVTPEPVRMLTASFNPVGLQTAAAAEPNPVALSNVALAVEIVSRMREGLRRFDIRLDPPELGRIDVRLEVDRNGHATTRLTVDKPETLDLLQRDARGLEKALQQAGLKTDQGGLEFTLRQQANDAAPDHRSSASEPRPDLLPDDEVERVEAVIEGYRSAAHARGGVDIRI